MPGSGVDRGDPLQRAALALSAKRPEEAQRIAEEVLRCEPRQARAAHILGCALLMQNRPCDAIAPLEAAARGRNNSEVETQLAIALLQTGRHEDALWHLKRIIRRTPPDANAFLAFGHLLLFMGRHDEAIEVLRRGVAIAPMMPEMLIQLGYALLERRAYSDAKTTFSQALTIAPTSAEALFGLGKAHYMIGEFETAADCFRRSLINRPDDYNTWLNLGHSLLRFGPREAGYECFRAAARGDPKRYGKALTSLAAASRGRAFLKPSAAARFLHGEKS
jgi:tetratricopeptide (TPR) repeat protein